MDLLDKQQFIEKICFSSVPLEVADHNDYKIATFLISVLDTWDLNGRMIPKETGEACHQSIIGFPILAKLIKNEQGEPTNFGDHEVQYKLGENGIEPYFDTTPIGSVTESWIEDREVAGYEGIKSCILIKAKLWSSRFPEYFKVFDSLYSQGAIASSWELTVHEALQTIKGRILKAVTFIGNTLLGSNILGAVPKAGVLEYATLEPSELKLAAALSSDIQKMKEVDQNMDKLDEKKLKDKEENKESSEQKEVKKVENDIETVPVDKVTEKKPKKKDEEEAKCDEHDKEKSDVAQKLIEKDDTILKLSAQVKELKANVASLMPYKEKVEAIEKAEMAAKLEKEKAELKEYAMKSGYITDEELESSEEVKSLIEKADKIGLKALICDRVVAALDEKKEEKFEDKLSLNLSSVSVEKASYTEIDLKNFINH